MNAAPMMVGWVFVAILGFVVVAGIIAVVRASTAGSGRSIGLLFAGFIAAGVLLSFFVARTTHMPGPPMVATPQYGPANGHEHEHGENTLPEPRAVAPRVVTTPEVKPHEPETSVFAPEKLTPKPAWLVQGTQTGNGVSQFPVSSELFATVAECQRDLDNRMPAIVAEELRFLVGEEYAIPLMPGEVKALTAETFTEEVPTTSQGNWYKVHRLVKVDKPAWEGIRERFLQAKSYARLRSLGMSFGGLMLAIGVVYLILRRPPRNVDPTLNTFSTT